MADNQAGIMTLPENQDMQKLSIFDSYDATKEALVAARPDAAQDISAEMQSLQGIADELTDDQLDTLIEAVQYLYENKEDYAKNIAELTAGGAGDLFPPEYDPEFLSTFNSILLEERKSRSANQAPPMEFARGGIADAARIMANQGRNGDTMLAHITPQEARMLRRQGGSGTINPVTGLPEFFNPLKAVVKLVKSAGKAVVGVIKSVASGVKKVLQSPVGRIVATIALTAALGPVGASWGLSAGMATSVGAGLASGAVTLAAGGNVKDAFKAAAFAAIAAPQGVVGSYVGPTTQAWAGTNEFARTAMEFGSTAAITSGAALLTGESLQDSVKQGLTSAAISTGTSIAQKQISSWKAAGDDIAAEAAKNKGFEQVAQDTSLRNAQETGNAFLSPSPSVLASADDALMAGRAGSPSTSATQATLAANAKANISPTDFVPKSAAGSTGSAFINDAGQFVSAADDVSGMPRIPNVSTYGSNAPGAVGSTTSASITPSTGRVPGILDSSKQIGGGILDIAKGDFSKGYENIVKGGGDLFFPGSPSSSDIVNSPDYKAAIAANVPPEAAYKVAEKSLSPGLLRTYGPATAAGIAGLALSGGFTPPDQPQSEQGKLLAGTPGEDLITKDADKYVVQNIPGVNYSPEGQILSATGAPSTISMQDVRVAPADYTATMQDVSRPTGNYAAAPMGPMQNQAPLMDPYQYYYQQYLASQNQPRYYAMGGITSLPAPMQAPPPAGIAALRDGGNSNYPRRTGQISGPGTEKSDSIPAMLSDGEFVMTASAVRGMGKGSRREGAKRMYALMHQLERNAARG